MNNFTKLAIAAALALGATTAYAFVPASCPCAACSCDTCDCDKTN